MSISDFVTVQWSPTDAPTVASPTWVDITGIVVGVEVDGGRSGVFELYGPRTATIRCRNGTKSPAVSPTFAIDGFYKWRQVNINSTAGELYFGYIETVEHDQSDAPGVGWVTITCTDELGVTARAELNATAGATVNGVAYALNLTDGVNAVVSASNTGAAVNIYGGSTAYFKFPDPDTGQAAPTGNALSWLQDVLEAEAGTIQGNGSHGLAVIGRWWPLTVGAGNTPTMTFSDTAGVGEYSYLLADLVFSETDENYYTRAVAKNSISDATFAASVADATLFTETLSRTSLAFIFDAWAEANASLWKSLYSKSVAFPKQLTIHMASPGALASVATSVVTECARLGYAFVVIKATQAGSATQKTYKCSVESFHHSITPTEWRTTLGFASQDRWRTAYGNGTTSYALTQIDGVTANGIDAVSIIAP